MSKKRINHILQKHVYGNPNNMDCLSRVIVDTRIKLIYNRIRKNANTYVTNIIARNQENGSTTITDVEDGGQSAKKLVPNLSNKIVFSDLSKYHSLLVIRDPFGRTLSAFLQKFAVQSYQQKFGAFELTPSGFLSFLDWLAEGGLNGDQHWDLQSREFAFPFSFFSEIVRFEDLNRDLPKYFADLGYDISYFQNENFFRKVSMHHTDSQNQAAAFLTPSAKRKIEKLYESDFQLFENYY